MTPDEVQRRFTAAYKELSEIASGGATPEESWHRLRSAATNYIDCVTPRRRFPVRPPADSPRAAAAAFVECALRDEYECIAAATVDCCIRWPRAVDAALRSFAHFPQMNPSIDLRLAFRKIWEVLPIYRASPADLAPALRLMLPPYSGGASSLKLYRGQSRADYDAGTYRCSWSTKPGTAWRYANYHKEFGVDMPTVILGATAPREGIICELANQDAEVVVDPAKLRDVHLMEALGC